MIDFRLKDLDRHITPDMCNPDKPIKGQQWMEVGDVLGDAEIMKEFEREARLDRLYVYNADAGIKIDPNIGAGISRILWWSNTIQRVVDDKVLWLSLKKTARIVLFDQAPTAHTELSALARLLRHLMAPQKFIDAVEDAREIAAGIDNSNVDRILTPEFMVWLYTVKSSVEVRHLQWWIKDAKKDIAVNSFIYNIDELAEESWACNRPMVLASVLEMARHVDSGVLRLFIEGLKAYYMNQHITGNWVYGMTGEEGFIEYGDAPLEFHSKVIGLYQARRRVASGNVELEKLAEKYLRFTSQVEDNNDTDDEVRSWIMLYEILYTYYLTSYNHKMSLLKAINNRGEQFSGNAKTVRWVLSLSGPIMSIRQ